MNLNHYSYYINCPCILFEEDQDKGYYSKIEGVDSHLGTVISERANYKPNQVKLILKTLNSFTDKDALNLLLLFNGDKVEELEYDNFQETINFGEGWQEYQIDSDYNITWVSEDTQQAIYFEYMLENRFDVFNLIGKGLAIDITKAKDYLVDLNN